MHWTYDSRHDVHVLRQGTQTPTHVAYSYARMMPAAEGKPGFYFLMCEGEPGRYSTAGHRHMYLDYAKTAEEARGIVETIVRLRFTEGESK